MELEDEFDFTLNDFEQHYVYLGSRRAKSAGPGLNCLETKSFSFVSNTGVSSQTSPHLAGSIRNTIPSDIRLLLSSTPVDDFRFEY